VLIYPDKPGIFWSEDMRCPYCRHADSRVVDSREAEDGQIIRRRRSCPECGRRFTTVEEAVLAVVKRSGVTEPFSRSKIIAGVRKACQGRPVDEDAIALLAQKVEEAVRARGAAELPSHEVGLAILAPLRDLDEVAYLRFASVYRSFDSLGDFEREIAALRAGAQAPRPGEGQGQASPEQHAQGEGPPGPAARAGEPAGGTFSANGAGRAGRGTG
jgi:transcriptional repressor NrdR